MDRVEIEAFLSIRGPNYVCVDVWEDPRFPGFVRTTTIRRDLTVLLEYELAHLYVADDMEGAHIKYRGRYDSLDAVIADLTDFLGRPVSSWKNFTANRYEPDTMASSAEIERRLYFSARDGEIVLPSRGAFELLNDLQMELKFL